jgi:RNA polymerase sigma factor for flagellar operon FliA
MVTLTDTQVLATTGLAPGHPGGQPPEVEQALWHHLAHGGEASAREALIAAYQPHARMLAAMVFARRVHDEILFEEYLQFATLAMIESVDRFDPDRGVQFATFSARRIQGAILDGLESLTERNQQIAASRRWRDERLVSLRLCETPPAAADTTEALFRQLADIGIGLALGFLLEGTGMIQGGDDNATTMEAPYHRLELQQVSRRVAHFVDQLTTQQQAVVRCHYFQHLRFDDIAVKLGLSKARVSQLHQQALLRLRALMSHSKLDPA